MREGRGGGGRGEEVMREGGGGERGEEVVCVWGESRGVNINSINKMTWDEIKLSLNLSNYYQIKQNHFSNQSTNQSIDQSTIDPLINQRFN